MNDYQRKNTFIFLNSIVSLQKIL